MGKCHCKDNSQARNIDQDFGDEKGNFNMHLF